MNISMFTVTEINVVGDLLCPLKVLSVLKRISDEDCQLLGLNPKYARPDWLILQVLPIPPPPVRPSVMMDTSSRSEASIYIHCFTNFPFSKLCFFFHSFHYLLILIELTHNFLSDNFNERFLSILMLSLFYAG